MSNKVTHKFILGDRFFATETQQLELKHLSLNVDLLETRYGARVVQFLITLLSTQYEKNTFLSPSLGRDTSCSAPDLRTLIQFVRPSLEIALDLVFPKYLSCFCNAQCDGSLYIGVSDDLEITGIPRFEGLSVDYLKTYITRLCNKYVYCEDSDVDVNTLYEVEILELDTRIDYISDDIAPVLESYTKSVMDFNDELYDYREKYQKWALQLNQASGRLINIVNTSSLRKELIAYMYDNRDRWTEETNKLCTCLENSQYVHFDTSYEHFGNVREDPSRIWYWVTRFKENKVKDLSFQKPRRPELCSRIHIPTRVATLADLRYRLVKLGTDYVLIKITFLGRSCTNGICFRFPKSSSLQKMRRGVDVFGEPCSIHMDVPDTMTPLLN